MKHNPGRHGPLIVLLACLAAPTGHAAEPTKKIPDEPEELTVIPVELDDPSEPLPGLPQLEWGLAGNLQLDGLLSSELPPEREKSSEIRRARISGVLQWNYDWLLKAGGDFSDGAELRELSLEYRGWPLHLEVGRMVEPFGVLQGSSRGSAMMERPQATALAPGYGVGLAANARGERWGFTAGIYKATRNSEFDEGGREEDAFTLRGTFTPLKAEDKMIHLGFAGSFREAKEGTLQFVAIPESVLLLGLNASSTLLFVDDESSNRYYLYGIEFASQIGPVVIQSEYMQAQIGEVFGFDESGNTASAGSPVYFSYYFETAWAVTGERRDYSTARGVMGGIHPESSILQGGLGAIELAARVSFINLIDSNLGGEDGLVTSLGINWYPEERVKLMLDVLQIEETRIFSSESTMAVQARAQVYFTAP